MYQVIVTDGKHKAADFGNDLLGFGLILSPKTGCYEIWTNGVKDIRPLKNFCKKNKLDIHIGNKNKT